MKILFIQNHFAPYRDDTFKKYNEIYNDEVVFATFGKDWHHPEWKYNEPQVKNYNIRYLFKFFNIGGFISPLFKIIKTEKPDCIVIYDLVFANLIRLRHPKMRVILHADSVKGNHGKIKNRILISLYNNSHGIWVPGKLSEEYFRNEKRYKKMIRHGDYTNDAVYIINKMDDLQKNREKERGRMGIKPTDFLFLFVGELIDNRHIEYLLESAKNINHNIKFLIVGQGKNIHLVEKYMSDYDNIHHIKSVPISDLESIYNLADGYIHPGEEPYSLALYEAAIVGLPIVATKNVGAVYDCIDKNGIVVKMGDVIAMRKAVNSIATDEEFSNAASRMKDFILKERGCKWAARQLYDLCHESSK